MRPVRPKSSLGSTHENGSESLPGRGRRAPPVRSILRDAERRGEARRSAAVGEIWSQQENRGLTARELIRLAQAVRLRPATPAE